MDETIDHNEAEEEILSYDVSDEALEQAAGGPTPGVITNPCDRTLFHCVK